MGAKLFFVRAGFWLTLAFFVSGHSFSGWQEPLATLGAQAKDASSSYAIRNLERQYCVGEDCAISALIGSALEKSINPSVDPTMQGSQLSDVVPVPRPRPHRTG